MGPNTYNAAAHFRAVAVSCFADYYSKDLTVGILLISNLINRLRLHQFLRTKTTEANMSLKTDANGAY